MHFYAPFSCLKETELWMINKGLGSDIKSKDQNTVTS